MKGYSKNYGGSAESWINAEIWRQERIIAKGIIIELSIAFQGDEEVGSIPIHFF
jgi:hypothetical protein